MSLGLPSSTTDLFASSSSTSLAQPTTAGAQSTSLSLGYIFSQVLLKDPAIKKQMTPAEQNAVAAVIQNVGMPDEKGSAAKYVLRALPYVKAVYSSMNIVTPDMPTPEEIAILMRSRYLQ